MPLPLFPTRNVVSLIAIFRCYLWMKHAVLGYQANSFLYFLAVFLSLSFDPPTYKLTTTTLGVLYNWLHLFSDNLFSEALTFLTLIVKTCFWTMNCHCPTNCNNAWRHLFHWIYFLFTLTLVTLEMYPLAAWALLWLWQPAYFKIFSEPFSYKNTASEFRCMLSASKSRSHTKARFLPPCVQSDLPWAIPHDAIALISSVKLAKFVFSG